MLSPQSQAVLKHVRTLLRLALAHPLQAVKELASFFRSFSSVDRIADVLRGIQDIQGSMRSDIMKDFEAV